MTQSIDQILVRGRSGVSLLLALGVLLAVGLACGSGKPAPSQYVGNWTGDDGTTIAIRADGSGDYKSGNSNITGGGVEIDESAKTLKITFAGLGPTYKIDSAPSGNKMTLDGVVFKKSGGGGDTKTSDAKVEIPSNDKLQTLVKTTFLDFGDAIQEEDFGDFHKKVAKVWQDQTSPDEMSEAFKAFVSDKKNYDFNKAVSPLDATFEPAPAMEKVSGLDALTVKGFYPTKPQKAVFELKYVMEDGTWKLISIDVRVRS